MAKLTLDLSGLGGLCPRFWGDLDRTVATPELRYIGREDQMANGIYNPFRRYGYMSPANATTADVPTGSILTTTLGSSQTWQTIGVVLNPSDSSQVPEFNGSASSIVEDTNDTSLTLSHTVGSSLTNSALIVAVQSMTGANPTGVTWDGNAMTQAVAAGDNGYLSFWYLLSPTAGTKDVIATWAVGVAEKSIHAMTFTGVTAVVVNATAKNSGTSTEASISLSPSVVNAMLIMATGSTNTTHEPGSSDQTERTEVVSTTNSFRYSTSTEGNITATIGSSIYDVTNNDFYFAERGQKIYKGTDLDDTILDQVLNLGTNGTPVIMDLEIYQINGTTKLFYAYETGGNMEIGEADLPFASANNNWLSTDVSGNFSNAIANDVFMRVSSNGFMYIFEENNIHRVDGTSQGGTTGTVSANIVQFPPYWRQTDAVDYRGNMYIAIRQDTLDPKTNNASVYNSEVGVFIWNRTTDIINMRDYIPLIGVKYIRKLYISPSGDLRMICANSERITQIRQFNGQTFEVIEEVGYLADFNYLDGLTTFSNFTTWMGDNGNIYAHGKPHFQDKEALYKIGNISDVTSTAPTGVVLFGGGSTDSGSGKNTKNGLYITYASTSISATIIKEWDIYGTGADGVNADQLQGDVYTLVKYLPRLSNVNYMDIYMFPVSSSGSTTVGTVKIYFNQSSTAWASKIITRDEAVLGYKSIEINKPYVNSIQLEIEFNTSVQTGSFDFAPSFAVVDYTPTDTRG